MQAIIPKPLVLAPSESLPDQEYLQQKRLFDLIVVALMSPFVLPVIAICALAVKLTSPGPVFFKQARTGIDGKPFDMLKFRSMIADAPNLKGALKAEHHTQGPDFKLENDPRVTWVGRILRKTSLDELPQLWNIVRGDMTLVGPRPTSFGADTYSLWHTERLEAKPGLTGLWQVEKRGDLDFDERVRLDIAYLRNRSLRLDMWILLRTIPAVLKQRGAY